MSAPQSLPPHADLQHLKYQAKDLLKAHKAALPETAHRLRQVLPEWADRSDAQVLASPFSLKDAQRAIARQYGFDQWADLKSHVESRLQQDAVDEVIRAPSIPRGYALDTLIAYFEAVRDRHVERLRRSLDEDPRLVDARIWPGHLQSAQLADQLRANPYPDPTWNITALHGLATTNSWTESEGPADEADRARTRQVIQTLIDYGADINALGNMETGDFYAPIVLAAWEGDLTTMQLLIDNGADLSGPQAVHAVETAATHERPERLRLLEAYGVNVPARMWLTAGEIDRVFALADADRSILDGPDSDGYTLVTAALAAWSPNYEVAEKLVQRGAQVDVFSATKLDLERLQALLHADPALANARLADGMTPLWLAAHLDAPEGVRILLNSGADPLQCHPLFRPAMFGYVEVTRLLLEGGCPIRDRDVACAMAYSHGGGACLQLLLEYGGDPNDRDGTRAALHKQSSKGHIGAVDVLLDAGADPNIRALGSLETPLHFATGHAQVVERLLSAGADPTRRNANSETALDLAVRKGQAEVAELLQTASKV
ncbi:MAG: hypothetical protein GKR89_12350 [Candidatus Latescibacteria bacterium]|nr:hypothetical protein [Candidatus Latescibacterota bacterium]